MLAVFRTLAFLAPGLAVAGLAVLVPQVTGLGEAGAMVIVGTVLIAGAGAGAMAAVAWIAGSRRLNRLARDLEALRQGNSRQGLPERGSAADRALARAVNGLAAAMADVEVRASRDRLTGVPNREWILGALIGAIERSQQSGRSLSVGFVDIDRFKAINDAHGHASGDAVLRQVAQLVNASIRGGDLVGRYGGEEFMLILPDTDSEGARAVAERLRALVMQTPLRIAADHEFSATVSIGIASGCGAGMRIDTLVAQADAAMYIAKSHGRNQTQIFSEVAEEALAAASAKTTRNSTPASGEWAGTNTAQALASLVVPQPLEPSYSSDQVAARHGDHSQPRR